MRYELFDFQKSAVTSLLGKMNSMQADNERDGALSSVSLTSPTGSGKTIIAAATVEGLFYGNDDFSSDPKASVLWLSDSPSLNEQTLKRFADASDMLEPTTSMQSIGSEFAQGHQQLFPGTIYFLNRQLLSQKGLLVKGNEGGRTFYDVLTNTIENPNTNLYLFIDEAHRGLGKSATKDSVNRTIYSKVVDGQKEINPPAPMVIGISATPERFNNAMKDRIDRDTKAPVKVSVTDVRKSGLIKDTIELRSPKQESNSNRADLKQACLRLSESTKLWKDYCTNNQISAIIPLLVVQVEDKIRDKSLGDLCHSITKSLPELNNLTSFANVFGEHRDIVTDFAKIPYIQPENVNSDTNIKILFAKDAISTGWDCPRAEVIYSQRTRKDPTYIAQLIGRMIRTPLARRIETIEELNTVSCYLPEYDEESVQEVVKHLKDDAITSAGQIVANPVPVGWFRNQPKQTKTGESGLRNNRNTETAGSLKDISHMSATIIPNIRSNTSSTSPNSSQDPSYTMQNHITGKSMNDKPDNHDPYSDNEQSSDLEGHSSSKPNESLQAQNSKYLVVDYQDMQKIKTVFETINTRPIEKTKSNYFRDLMIIIDLISGSLNPTSNLNKLLQTKFYKKLESLIMYHSDAFELAHKSVTTFVVSVKRVDPLTGDTIEEQEDAVLNDLEASMTAYTDALKQLSGGSDLGTSYINTYSEQHDDMQDAIWRFTAAMNTPIILKELSEWAKNQIDSLISQYKTQRYIFSEEDKSKWDRIVGNVKPYVEDKTLIISAASPRQDSTNKTYPKHIICDDEGKAYIKLNDLEDAVVTTEISRPINVAWYRNTARNQNASLAIPYNLGGKWKSMYPDFIFFQKTTAGKIVPIIVDPHGDWLGDSIAKLKGYVKYLRDFPDTFAAVQAVADQENGTVRYLDLMDSKVQDAISQFSGDTAIELFSGPLSNEYQIIK